MIRRVSRFVLWLFGWKTSGLLPEGLVKAVIIVAPHTSYWDFVIGRLTFWGSKVKVRVLIKKEVFFFPLGLLLRQLGGVPVARGKKNNMIEQVVELFGRSQSLAVVITPEGTRKLVHHWKRGFYLIALQAKVPIALAYIDYGNKTGGIGSIFYPTGDFEKDMEVIQDFYRDKTGKHPEQFNLSPKSHHHENLPQKH
jgi:1-acyl-sn-glycerol-3-phosphate acyltransferase